MYSEREWLAHVDRFGWRCQYCGTALTTQREGENRALLTKDHIVPISTGGADEIPNLLPACLRCNRMKKNKRLENWLRERPRLTRFYTENRQVLSILEKERKKQKQKLDEAIRNLACHVAFPVDTHFRTRQTEFLFPNTKAAG